MGSAIRCFLTSGSEGSCKKRPQRFRLASYWWLLMVNTTLMTMLGAGLEAFASRETREAVENILRESGCVGARSFLDGLSMGPYRWLGLAIDQCSVGVCATNFLRSKLRFYVEPDRTWPS
jgi:hypothetical protein